MENNDLKKNLETRTHVWVFATGLIQLNVSAFPKCRSHKPKDTAHRQSAFTCLPYVYGMEIQFDPANNNITIKIFAEHKETAQSQGNLKTEAFCGNLLLFHHFLSLF